MTTPVTHRGSKFSAEQDIAYVKSIAHLADGARVRVLSARCQKCGESYWIEGEVGTTYTVAAAVLRKVAQLQHHDDCDGRLQFETEPV